MKTTASILLFILITFIQVDFAQKKFIATELSVTEGLQGKKIKTYLEMEITKYRVTVYDKQGVLNQYVSLNGYFGMNKMVDAYDSYTDMYCTVHMYGKTICVTFKGSRQVLWFTGTFYY